MANHVKKLVNEVGGMNRRSIVALIGGILFLTVNGCGSPGWMHPGKSGFERWQDARECRREGSNLSAGGAMQGSGSMTIDYDRTVETCMTAKGYHRTP